MRAYLVDPEILRDHKSENEQRLWQVKFSLLDGNQLRTFYSLFDADMHVFTWNIENACLAYFLSPIENTAFELSFL